MFYRANRIYRHCCVCDAEYFEAIMFYTRTHHLCPQVSGKLEAFFTIGFNPDVILFYTNNDVFIHLYNVSSCFGGFALSARVLQVAGFFVALV